MASLVKRMKGEREISIKALQDSNQLYIANKSLHTMRTTFKEIGKSPLKKDALRA